MIFSLKLKASCFITKFPLIALQPVLPENLFVFKSKFISGIFPAAVSDANTGINFHLPSMEEVSDMETARYDALFTNEEDCVLYVNAKADNINPAKINRFIQ